MGRILIIDRLIFTRLSELHENDASASTSRNNMLLFQLSVIICRNMWNVWRTVLEENEKLARARLAAVEVFQQQIADDAKILRTHKIQAAKKVSRIKTS